jgi:precorrin-6Y C5,15-methyltransferase (decarboxylating)
MITVVGMDGSPLGPQAEAALAGATLVAGARRHLAAVSTLAPVPARPAATANGLPQAQVIVLGELAPALDALAAHDGDAVVLASGDPGFFGIVRALRERGLACAVLPAVSSVGGVRPGRPALGRRGGGQRARPGPTPGAQRVPGASQGRGPHRAGLRPGGDRGGAGRLGPPAHRP